MARVMGRGFSAGAGESQMHIARSYAPIFIIAGLVPAILFGAAGKDGRDTPGHDDGGGGA
ncbi:hypothetical protein DK847_18340 [Aestuariivirga litoralis]|uniref:Uncharacterized protein n=1 Tax=Aestuariivirga litoralis TaxID=2650924 RepID=A0A2W2BQ01_9HYPH|nr:hypothetical protein DK847_18340 [Aestuariivirga litoralis]